MADAAPVPGRQPLAEAAAPRWGGWEDLAEEPEDDHGAELAHLDSSPDVDGDDPEPGDDSEGAELRAAPATAEAADASTEGEQGEEASDADFERDGAADDGDDDGDESTARMAAASSRRSPIPTAPASAGAHDAPYERDVAAGVHYAKEDQYNRGSVKDNVFASKYHVDRPGVRVGKKRGKPRSGRDLFTLNKDTAKRYTFVNENGKNVAREFDTVEKKDLTVVNWKFTGAPQPAGKTRLLLNPATPRKLQIGAARKPCVFSWVGGFSAAWIELADLKMPGHSRQDIMRAVRSQALRARPGRAPASMKTVKFEFRPANTIGQSDKRDKGPEAPDGSTDRPLVLGPSHGQGGNEVGHYLGKTIGDNTLYPISQTLPQNGAAILACDTALAGDRFFVPRDRKFVREVSIYKHDQKKSRRRQTWVYGFVGKRENGKWVADRTRPGWVPLRTIMPSRP